MSAKRRASEPTNAMVAAFIAGVGLAALVFAAVRGEARRLQIIALVVGYIAVADYAHEVAKPPDEQRIWVALAALAIAVITFLWDGVRNT